MINVSISDVVEKNAKIRLQPGDMIKPLGRGVFYLVPPQTFRVERPILIEKGGDTIRISDEFRSVAALENAVNAYPEKFRILKKENYLITIAEES